MTPKPNQLLRTSRTWHRKVASVLNLFFFFIACTAILLAFKDSFVTKIYKSDAKQKANTSVAEWLPLDSLKSIATVAFAQKVPNEKNAKATNMNAVFDKGYVRFTFAKIYNVQVNAATGELQNVEKKAPDWILKLHDGEIVSDFFGLKNIPSKTIYTTMMGLALLFLTLSGFWMWFRPKQIRKSKRESKEQTEQLVFNN
jgi:uncharacterized iron-regulated membrane protein